MQLNRIFSRILLTLVLVYATGGVNAFQRAAPETLGFDPAALQEIDRLFLNYVENGDVPGAVVAIQRGDKLPYLKSFGHLTPAAKTPMSDQALFRIYSMTKPIVSAAVMALIEQEKLSLDVPLHKFIPAFKDPVVWTAAGPAPAERPIRIVDLLRHTSGLVYGFFGTGHVRDLYRQAGLLDVRRSNAEFADALAKLPLEQQPGTAWTYGMSTDVLGRVIEVVSGQSLSQFLQTTLFTPLGMTDTSFHSAKIPPGRVAEGFEPLGKVTENARFQSGGGGLVSSLADYLAFAQMLRDGGQYNGRQILQPETVALMTQDHLGDRPRSQWDGPGFGYGFGLGVAVRTQATAKWPGTVGDFFWTGYAGTCFWVDPEKDMIVVLMMQSVAKRDVTQELLHGLVYNALKE